MAPVSVYGAEMDEYDLSGIEENIEENNIEYSFEEIINDIFNGNTFEDKIADRAYSFFCEEVISAFKGLKIILYIIIFSALIKPIAEAFNEVSVVKSANLILYFIVISIVFCVFKDCMDVAKEIVNKIMSFLFALFPTFFCAVSFVQGSLTGGVFYQWSGLCITLINSVVVKVLLPMINYYTIIGIINNIWNENEFNNLLNLLKKAVTGINNFLIGAIVTVTAVKGITVPGIDGVQKNLLKKSISLIPGVGNSVETIVNGVISTGNIIKNTIGIAGIIVLIFIVLSPIIKIFAISFVYKILNVAVEPFVEKKIINGIDTIIQGIDMLIYVSFTSVMVFISMIALMCFFTGG